MKPAGGGESVAGSKEAGELEAPASSSHGTGVGVGAGLGRPQQKAKPPFRPAADDTKPLLRDPILRSDPTETEQAVLRPPPFP